jgi:GT2 family glycosyltransferase
MPRAQLVLNAENRGFARACNAGAAKADGEYLLFLNPDVRLDEGAVEALTATARSDVLAGAVGARLRYADGRFQATCRKLPTVGNMVFSRGSFTGRLFGGGHIYTLPDYPDTTQVPALAATVMLLKAGVFRRMRGFDERFFMYMEDTDLCCRLHRSGRRNYFVPYAGGVHGWGEGSDAGRIRRQWFHHNSVWKYFLKHLPNGFSVFILPVFLTINFLLVVLLEGVGVGRRK